MPYVFIGVGQCGGAIIDAAFYDEVMFKIAVPIAINSATLDLQTLKNLGREHWVGMSRDRGFIPGTMHGFEHFVSGGYGKNRARAEEDALRFRENLKEVIVERTRVGEGDSGVGVPVAFVAFALGGGTGSGAGPVVAGVLKEMGVPVIAVVVLPATHEGGLTAKNSVESLNLLIENVDSVILVDNQKLAHAESAESLFQRYNEYVARSIRDILIGTAIERVDPSRYEGYAPVIDLKDMIAATSFSFGKRTRHGFAALGRASERTRNFLHYIFPFGGHREIDVISLLYRSFMKLTVAELRPEHAEKNLVLLRIPPVYLTKRGRINTSMAKQVMEEHSRLGETHFGVALTKRNLATATVLLTYRPNQISRLRTLSQLASQYKDISLRVLEEYEKDFLESEAEA
ncbi:MAG: hypothetical protein GXO66_09730 [Euryarchaeota archaeon]|nr:hypothetical protein [Euryarchaeota archaeon]